MFWGGLRAGKSLDFRIFQIFPKWNTATLVGQDSAWEVQKRYFRSKKTMFFGYFWPYPIIWGFPLGLPVGPFGSVHSAGPVGT